MNPHLVYSFPLLSATLTANLPRASRYYRYYSTTRNVDKLMSKLVKGEDACHLLDHDFFGIWRICRLLSDLQIRIARFHRDYPNHFDRLNSVWSVIVSRIYRFANLIPISSSIIAKDQRNVRNICDEFYFIGSKTV